MKRRPSLRFLIGNGLLFAVLLVPHRQAGSRTAAPATGIIIVVDSTGDGVNTVSNDCNDGTGHCTLRAAIQYVNARNNGGDHISIAVTGAIELGAALPNLQTPVGISGFGSGQLVVTRLDGNPNDGAPYFRIFNVTTSGTVSISGMTITNGHPIPPGSPGDLGGGLQNFNAGIVNLTDCVIAANFATAAVNPPGQGGGIANRAGGVINLTNCMMHDNDGDFGGGIYNDGSGTITITNSRLYHNSSATGGGIYNVGTANLTGSTLDLNTALNGGGIYNYTGVITISNSTIASNRVQGGTSGHGYGGGAYNDSPGTLHVINSTFFNNTADQGTPNSYGGGIYNKATLTVSNSTIAANTTVNSTSGYGGGIYNDAGGSATIKGTIIAKNLLGSGGFGIDVYGSFISQGYNLIGIRNDSTGFTAPTDQTGSCTNGDCTGELDPGFELDSFNSIALEDNGGPTKTIALVCGSPAMDKGTSNGLAGTLTTDQRETGFARAVDDTGIPNAAGGDGTDVGAFEYGAGPIAPTSVVSRKFHGSGGSPSHFDIPLPLSCGSMGIECRRNTGSDTGGPNAGHDHEIIATFPTAVTVSGGVNLTGAGNGATATFIVNGNTVTVDLHNVPNPCRVTINLRNVSDGTHTGLVSIPIGILLGDTSGNGSVNASDVSLTKSKSGQSVDATNFRADVTANGAVNASDVSAVKANSGSGLP